ncbi:MAG: mechanosensitive ion channel family protein [Treponema sp.]|nr:mechanosensitive ion channel family protein [Treponema sp.]
MEESELLHEVTEAAVVAVNETVGQFSSQFVDFVKTLLTWKNAFRLIGALFVIFLMWLAFKLIKHFVKKVSAGKIQQQYVLVITKTISYVFYALVVMYVLSLFGVKLGAIWGAAGIAGVAVGFAAQTSVSNLISGLFVLGEKAMKVGDFIEVGGVSGTVDSVGLLSVKVHTLNNQMVRIPNSSIINSNFQNNSFFEVRRFSFELSVDYATDMNVALQALSSVPELCPSVLKEPAPAVWYNGFGESGINIVLAVWFNSSDLVKMKNEVYIAIKKVFDEKGINIPFNRLDVSMVEA